MSVSSGNLVGDGTRWVRNAPDCTAGTPLACPARRIVACPDIPSGPGKSSTKKAIGGRPSGAQFTKLGAAHTVAAREGGGDPGTNASLTKRDPEGQGRIDAQRTNIERAIAKGPAPGRMQTRLKRCCTRVTDRVASRWLIEAYTENRNRNRRRRGVHLLSKPAGTSASPAAWPTCSRSAGVVMVDGARYARRTCSSPSRPVPRDIVADDESLEVITAPSELSAVRAAIEGAGIEIETAEVLQRPEHAASSSTRRPRPGCSGSSRRSSENDDVGAVHANFEVSDEILEEGRRLSGPAGVRVGRQRPTGPIQRLRRDRWTGASGPADDGPHLCLAGGRTTMAVFRLDARRII